MNDEFNANDIEQLIKTGDIHAILGMVSPNVEERKLRDVFLLANASDLSFLDPLKQIDLLGQAIFIAYYFQEDIEYYGQLIDYSVCLALKQLAICLEIKGLPPELIDNPIVTLSKIYTYAEELYAAQKIEALRISQIFFYSFLHNIKDVPKDSKVDYFYLCITLGAFAVSYAHVTENFYECLSLSDIVLSLFMENKGDFLASESWLDLRIILHELAITNIRASVRLNRKSQATKWAEFSDNLSEYLDKEGNLISFFVEKAETLIEQGKAEEALKYYNKIYEEIPQQKNNNKASLFKAEYLNYRITGNVNNIIRAYSDSILNKTEIADFLPSLNAWEIGVTSVLSHNDFFKIVEKILQFPVEKNLAIDESMSTYMTSYNKNASLIIDTLAKCSDGDINSFSTLLKNIDEMGCRKSLIGFPAFLFSLYLRQDFGATITWEMIEPLVRRLMNIEGFIHVLSIVPLALILYRADEWELVKGADTIWCLIQCSINEDNKNIPYNSFQLRTNLMPVLDLLLALIAKIALVISDKRNEWLERIAKLKYFYSYRVPRQLQQAKINSYSVVLPQEDVQKIYELTKTLAWCTLFSKEKNGVEQMRMETQLMALLYPFTQWNNLSIDSLTVSFSFPEQILAEVARFPGQRLFGLFTLNILFNEGEWQQFYVGNIINKKYIRMLMNKIRKNRPLDFQMNAFTAKLKEIIFPFIVESCSFSLLGIRTSGMFHDVPFDILPMKIDEENGIVTRRIGEEMVTVLLTRENQAMGMLYNPIAVKNFAIFANATFTGLPYHSLPGVQEEAKAILSIVKHYPSITLDFYWEAHSNRNNFLNLSGDNAPEILHIATHAIANENNPANSCFIFSGKDERGVEVLAAAGYFDIILMDLRKCHLVVLSSCSTYEGKIIRSEGIMGLAQAFKVAGAKVVIASRWKVDDQVAVVFWSFFYDRLLAGQPIGQAFREARLFIMTQNQWKHPYYWGVFQLIV